MTTEGTPAYEEVDEDMRRRALLATDALVLFDRPLLGEVLELPTRPDPPTPLPTRLGQHDVAAIEELARSLEREARYYGGGHDVLSPVAQRAERLLQVPSTPQTKVALAVAIADLHNVTGWAAFDAHQDDTARYHFARAMSLGNEGDGYQFAPRPLI